MAQAPDFDLSAAHRYFSAHCFNATWSILDQPERSPADDERLIALAHTSYWHWTERGDQTPKKLSIAFWLLARVYAVVGQGHPAMHYAERARQAAKEGGVPPYFLGCAWEAIARAAHVLGEQAKHDSAAGEARRIADELQDVTSREMLLADVDSIGK